MHLKNSPGTQLGHCGTFGTLQDNVTPRVVKVQQLNGMEAGCSTVFMTPVSHFEWKLAVMCFYNVFQWLSGSGWLDIIDCSTCPLLAVSRLSMMGHMTVHVNHVRSYWAGVNCFGSIVIYSSKVKSTGPSWQPWGTPPHPSSLVE